MATKRFGEIESDLIGSDGQLLRVNDTGTGFEFVEPATIPEYTVTNPIEDRSIDLSNTDLDEVAAVLGTLISDLEASGLSAAGGGLSAFQWSTSEQVWPFEKDILGNTLYCKEIDFGALPNSGSKTVAHGISGLAISDIFKVDFAWKNSSLYALYGYTWVSESMNAQVDSSNVIVNNNVNLSGYNGTFRLIYSK